MGRRRILLISIGIGLVLFASVLYFVKQNSRPRISSTYIKFKQEREERQKMMREFSVRARHQKGSQ